MSGWPIVALGEVAHIDRTVVNPITLSPETPYIGLEHIRKGGQRFSFSSVEESAVTSTKHVFTQEHVLMGKLRPNLAKVILPQASGVCSTDILPLRVGDQLDKSFLRYHLLRPEVVDWVSVRAAGANLPRISPKALAEMPVPCPDLNEQRRIVAILDRATTTHFIAESRKLALGNLKAAVFHRFASQADAMLPLENLALIRAGNSLADGEEFMGQGGGSLLLRVSDLNHPVNARRVTVAGRWNSEEADRSTSAPAGSVVFPKRGGAIATNKKRILDRAAQLDPNLMGLVPMDGRCPTDWLAAWLDTIDLGMLSNGSSVPQINKKDIKDLLVPVASIQNLELFRQLSQKLEKLQLAVEHQMDLAQELYSSLQYRAFGGEL